MVRLGTKDFLGVSLLPDIRCIRTGHGISIFQSQPVLSSCVQRMVLTFPPQHDVGVAAEHSQVVRVFGNIQAEALLGFQVKEAVLGHPLPQRVVSSATVLGHYPVGQRLDALASVFMDDGEWIVTWVETVREDTLGLWSHLMNSPCSCLFTEESLINTKLHPTPPPWVW